MVEIVTVIVIVVVAAVVVVVVIEKSHAREVFQAQKVVNGVCVGGRGFPKVINYYYNKKTMTVHVT